MWLLSWPCGVQRKKMIVIVIEILKAIKSAREVYLMGKTVSLPVT